MVLDLVVALQYRMIGNYKFRLFAFTPCLDFVALNVVTLINYNALQ
jgi:hypothetical protein